MTTYRANLSNALNPAIRYIAFNTYRQYSPEYTQVYHFEDTDYQEVKETSMSGFTTVPRKYEGQAFAMDNPYQGYITTYTQLVYALGFAVTWEMYRYDLSGKIKKLPQALSRSVRQTEEVLGWGVINRGFTNAGADGVALFATNHPVLRGGTFANTTSPAVDLSVSGIQQMLLLAHQQVDENGFPAPFSVSDIWVHPTKEVVLDELLLSMQKPYTGDNEINALARKGLKGHLGHWLTATGAWFSMVPKADRPESLKFLWSAHPTMDKFVDDYTKNLVWDVMFACGCGYTDARGMFGFNGT